MVETFAVFNFCLIVTEYIFKLHICWSFGEGSKKKKDGWTVYHSLEQVTNDLVLDHYDLCEIRFLVSTGTNM